MSSNENNSSPTYLSKKAYFVAVVLALMTIMMWGLLMLYFFPKLTQKYANPEEAKLDDDSPNYDFFLIVAALSMIPIIVPLFNIFLIKGSNEEVKFSMFNLSHIGDLLMVIGLILGTFGLLYQN